MSATCPYACDQFADNDSRCDACQSPAMHDLATGHAASEVHRVRRATGGFALGPHPLAELSDEGWSYVRELIRGSFLVGAAAGSEANMRDVNSRYMLYPRRDAVGERDTERSMR